MKDNFDRELIIGIGFGIGFFIVQAIYDEIKKNWRPEADQFYPSNPY